MGRQKALLNFGGEPLILRQVRLVQSAGVPVQVVGLPELYRQFGLEGIADEEPGLGPLGGIATALAHSRCDWNLIVAVDLPNVTAAWLRALLGRAFDSGADALLPRSEGGLEPLCAAYHRRCLEPIRGALARGVRKVTDGLAGPPPCRIEEIGPEEWIRFAPGGKLFENINTPAEYERAVPGGER
jgi:molybdopterin-guanine dinucleotide biosynthesis protein A